MALLVLVLPLLPTLAAGLVALAARQAGCARAGGACPVLGLDAGSTIRGLLDAAWSVPIAISGGLLAVWAVVATILWWRAVDGFFARFATGGLLVATGAIATIVAPVTLVLTLADGVPNCLVNEGGVGDCVIHGVAQGSSFHTAAVAPWLLYLYLPAALAYVVGVLVLLVLGAAISRSGSSRR